MRVIGAALATVIVCAACGGGNAASQLAKPPEFQPKDQTKCGVEKSQARPLIVEWPSADRQELESRVHEGIVVVRYQGCQMDVLERCSVPAQYGYRGTTLAQDKLVMKDDDDLYANLPVGAAKLEGKLEKSGRLTVDMDLVGRYEAQKPSVRLDELQGDCAGATHFVYGLSVGAFDFYAGADATVGGGVAVAGIGAGGSSSAQRETLTKNGEPDSCARASPDDKAPPAQCGALIRIEVVPLAPAPSAADAAQIADLRAKIEDLTAGVSRSKAVETKLFAAAPEYDARLAQAETLVDQAPASCLPPVSSSPYLKGYASAAALHAALAQARASLAGIRESEAQWHDPAPQPVAASTVRELEAQLRSIGIVLSHQEDQKNALKTVLGTVEPLLTAIDDVRACARTGNKSSPR